MALKSQAVLFRADHHSGPLDIELTRRNIPFVKFGGLKFLDSAHVKDVLAVLAVCGAKDSLHLITPQRFFVHGQAARGDRHVYASRTRFIDDHMLDHFARTSWPPPSQDATGRDPQPDIRVDLKARMRGMWR